MKVFGKLGSYLSNDFLIDGFNFYGMVLGGY